MALLLWMLSISLGGALYYRHTTSNQELRRATVLMNQLSNQCHTVTAKLDEQTLVNQALEKELTSALEEATGFSNRVTKVAADLTQARQVRAGEKPQPQQPDPRVSQLESERDGLTAQLDDLTGAMSKLDGDLAETKRKLEASEGDRSALLEELKRLEAERSKLMLRFNDLALLREQMRKLKAEQAVSKRLAWMRRGVYGSSKGAELLRKGLASAAPAGGNYDLNVEVRRNETTPSVSPDPTR